MATFTATTRCGIAPRRRCLRWSTSRSGIADPHFDLRYLPGNSHGPQLVLAVTAAYEQLSGRRLSIERVMAWHVLTALGDALWRTEAGVALPGGGTAITYVDRLESELAALGLG